MVVQYMAGCSRLWTHACVFLPFLSALIKVFVSLPRISSSTLITANASDIRSRGLPFRPRQPPELHPPEPDSTNFPFSSKQAGWTCGCGAITIRKSAKYSHEALGHGEVIPSKVQS
ncbi:hypothetical protein V8E36_006069 [Tilletia maclaganii]